MADNLDDLYFVGQPPEDIDIVATSIMDNPIIVLAAPGHPLANKKKITLEQLARELGLMREKGSGTATPSNANWPKAESPSARAWNWATTKPSK